MKLPVPFAQLPLSFDAEHLAAEVAALGEASWRPHPQGYAGNAMLPLVAVEGDPADERFIGPMRPTPFLARCPYLAQAMASLGCVLGRSRLMRLSGHAEVNLHVDQGYYWAERMRVHVPVMTQPTVRFDCGDASVHMQAGECWIFDTWRKHRVLNDAEASRIHLVVDTVGGDGLHALLARGRPHAAPWPSGFEPTHVPPGAPSQPLVFETDNVPVVMTPWELNAHLAFLFGETVPHPHLDALRQRTGEFSRNWRALWAQHGDAAAGRPQFRAAMERCLDDVRDPSQDVVLRNELRWFAAVVTLVGKVAVADDSVKETLQGLGDNA